MINITIVRCISKSDGFRDDTQRTIAVLLNLCFIGV
jgi:hypothetical protein